MRTTRRLVFFLAAGVVLGGCIQERMTGMRPEVGVGTNVARDRLPLKAALVLPATVRKHVWTGNVSGTFVGSAVFAEIHFGEALTNAVKDACARTIRDCSLVENRSAPADLYISPTVEHYEFRWASMSWGSATMAESLTGKVVFASADGNILEKTYQAKQTGADRGGMTANHGSTAEAVVGDFVEQLFGDLTSEPDLVSYLGKMRRANQRIDAQLTRDLVGVNAMYRVTGEKAVVREAPNAESYALDDYPNGSVVHVIGELPSGWLQVAREGKPFGWAHASAMRPEKRKQAAAKAAPGAKPAIYIASPKPGDEVAEPVVRILGYVTSANRTEDLRVYVNHRLVPTQSLWSDTPIQARGLRGFPLKLTVPLGSGDNKIEVHVLDQQGFLVNQALSVRRIDITEAARPAAVTDLPARLADVAVAERTQAVSADNFMAVLGSWVKDTAKTDYNKGNLMFDAGRFARAAYYYRKSIKTEPMGQAWFNLGISEQALGRQGKAIEAFSKACRNGISQACNASS